MKIGDGYLKVGPIAERIKRITSEDDDPFFVGIDQLDDGVVYLLPKKEPFKAALAALVKGKGLSVEEAVRTLIKERLAPLVQTEKPQSRRGRTEKGPKAKAPQAPDPSCGGDTMKTATGPLTHFWGQALTAGGPEAKRRSGGWVENQFNQAPKFARARITHGGGEATVYFESKTYSALELWGNVYSIDDVVLETYMVILALMCDYRNATPPGYVRSFIINPSQVLDLAGFKRFGEDRRVALRRVIDAVKLLASWSTDFSGFPLPPDKKGKPRFAEKRGCKIFHVLSSWHCDEQGELFEKENGELEHAPLAISCVSGEWLEFWMNSQKNYCWIQAISRNSLKIPGKTRAERLAKRIAMLLLGFVAGTNHINGVVKYTVQEILEDLVMLPTDEYRGLGGGDAKKGTNWANRTDKDLFGWWEDDGGDFIEGGGESCSGAYHPGAFDILQDYGILAQFTKGSENNPYPNRGDRQQGWVERWLSVPVYMMTPEAAEKIATTPLPDSLTQDPSRVPDKPPLLALPGKLRNWKVRGTGKPKKKLTAGQYLDTALAERLRTAIAQRFINQAEAAQHFGGVTQSGLSRVLNRNRAPGPELALKLKAFLDSLPP